MCIVEPVEALGQVNRIAVGLHQLVSNRKWLQGVRILRSLKIGANKVNRTQKREAVAELNEIFTNTASVVVTQYNGLNVAEISDLRRQMRNAGATFKVTKNRLTKLALEGTPYDLISDLFAGPTGIAFSDDPIAPAKIAVNFSKDNEKLVVLGGAMGDSKLDVDGVKALAALPSLEELRGTIVGLLQGPATKLLGVVQAPASQLVRVMSAQGSKEEAA